MKRVRIRLVCGLLSTVLVLGVSACGNSSAPISTTAPPTTTQEIYTQQSPIGTNNGDELPSGYQLEVQQTGERSGVIRLTDPHLPQNEPTGISDGAGNTGDYLYCWEIGIGDTWLLERAFLIGEKSDPSKKGYPVERVTTLKVVENGQASLVSEVTAIADGKTITWDFTIPDSYDFSWDAIPEYTMRIEHKLNAMNNLSATVPAANVTWTGEAAQGLPFTMAFEDRTVYLRMPMPKREFGIRFGDFSLDVRTNQGVNYYGAFDEGIIFDLMYKYGGNTGAIIEPVAGWESTWGDNNIFIRIEIPNQTVDGPNDIIIDWNNVGNPRFEERHNGQPSNEPPKEFDYHSVVVDYSELKAQFLDAWTEQRVQKIESPMPMRGKPFDLPTDFGYEAHEADSAYFFSYSDDYAVIKYDLRDIYVDSTVVGKADWYTAYNYEPDNSDLSWFQMDKFVLQDHHQALQLVREISAINHGVEQASMGGHVIEQQVIDSFFVNENVVYPIGTEPADMRGITIEQCRHNITPPYLAYTTGPNDPVWLTPTASGLYPGAVWDPTHSYILHYSKTTLIEEWDKVISSGMIKAGQYYASKP